MRIGRRLTVYLTRRWRWFPDAGVSWMSRFFRGGFHFRWLAFSVEYEHLSRRWMAVKHSREYLR
jgi:hypothetical protein